MDNAWCAVREGGVVIIIGECEEGSGSKVLEETCKRLGSADAIQAELEKRFEIGANKAFAVTRLTKKAKFILVSSLDKELAHNLLFESVETGRRSLGRSGENCRRRLQSYFDAGRQFNGATASFLKTIV